MDDLLTRFRSFLDASPTPQHAVATTAGLLDAAGFREVHLVEPPALPPGTRGYVRQDGSIFAFRVGRRSPAEVGFRIVAAHTDSPNLRVKPNPVQRSNGYVRLGVEVYGGAQVPTWVDRDLGIAGAVHLRSGQGLERRLVTLRRPVARVPTLAIHLNRKVNEEGLKLNAQRELPALLCQETDDEQPLRTLLAAELGRDPKDLLTWDLSLFDLVPASVGGANGEFVFSARLDNLGSSHAALEALLAADDPDVTSVVALFDHEEIGSRTSRGADSRAIEAILGLLVPDASLTPALARTVLLSADMAHAIHPAFADKSDPEHAPRMNGGPAIKLNANGRYTSEGESAALFVLLCERWEIPYQWYVHRSDLACGSTVGPMLASRLGVRALDVGNPMLSMHSVREQCGAHDHPRMVRAMTAFLTDPLG